MLTVQEIHLGPIMFPWGLAIPIIALVLSLLLGKFLFPKFKITTAQWQEFKDSIWNAVLIALLSARVSFILFHLDSYLAHPMEIIKIQDKGFHLYTGIVVAFAWIIWKNKPLSKKFLAILLLSFSMLNLGGFALLDQVQMKYQQYPDFNLQTLNQQPIALSQFTGKPTVINLWATWCPPCRREMPVLLEAQKNHPDVEFVLINQGEDATTIEKYLQNHAQGLSNVLLDPQGQTAEKTGMFGLPSTLFFDAQGKLIASHMGELTHASLNQKIKQIRVNIKEE
ncbi:TlpA family protein disulfide reductase [Acinetobacter sp. 1207_04]